MTELPILEAVSLTVDTARSSSYPFPELRITNRLQALTMRAIQLQNRWLKIILLPDLGGRIVKIQSTYDSHEFLMFSPIFAAGGRRGADLQTGLEVCFDGHPRLNSLGPTESDFTEDENGARAVVYEAAAGEPLAWHLFATLPPDQACLDLELRVYNRSWETVRARPGLRFPTGSGIGITGDADAEVEFSAHQTETFHFRIIPTRFCSGRECKITQMGMLALGEDISFEPTCELEGKADVRLRTGETLSAPFAATPDRAFTSALPGPVEEVAIIAANGDVLSRFPALDVTVATLPGQVLATQELIEFPRAALGERAKFEALRTLNAIRVGNAVAAESALNQAMTFNADDPWLWWLKSRLDSENDEALPNAHFLSPFEPVLRAQGFLNQNHQVAEPSPLVAPLAANPDALIDIACQLFELHDYESLSRWVDECLRHREVSMLRYLLADALFENSRMDVEAATNVRKASDSPINPPYPWREVEFMVLSRLLTRFPGDSRIAELLAMMGASRYNPK
ncbi:MAG: hypothetical protein ABL949_00105 [Fimbriimonadaceae bacterium]